jgi:hypothetical protein
MLLARIHPSGGGGNERGLPIGCGVTLVKPSMSTSPDFNYTTTVAALVLAVALVAAVAAGVLVHRSEVGGRVDAGTPQGTVIGEVLPHAFPGSHPAR